MTSMPRSRSRSTSPSRRRNRSPAISPRRDRTEQSNRRRDRSWNGERSLRRRSISREPRPVRKRSASPVATDTRHGRRDREAARHEARDGGRGDSHRHHSRNRSPPRHSPEPYQRSKRPLPSQNAAFKGDTVVGNENPQPEKQKPNFRPSGLLAAASNTVNTSRGNIVLKYHEPADARKPPSSQTWRLYVFKGEEILDTLELYSQSCWLFGRETSVCDYPLDHPSCSKQHAVIQFRYIEKRNEFGDKIGRVRPYAIDLESGNGTTVNGQSLPAGRYFELRDKDVIKFGHSTREYAVQLPSAT